MSKLKTTTKVLWKHNAKARFETLKIQIILITSICIEYIGEFMALTQNGPMPVFL